MARVLAPLEPPSQLTAARRGRSMRARMAMRATQCVATLALLLAPLCALGAASVEVPAPNTAEEAAETLSFFATADWGGQAAAPYTTPLQLLMATAMGRASASFHPKFVLSAGGNFLPGGLAGARRGGQPARARGQPGARRCRGEAARLSECLGALSSTCSTHPLRPSRHGCE